MSFLINLAPAKKGIEILSNPSSTTSKYLVFVCFYFDLLSNIVLSTCHSRDIFEQGFTVDNKRAFGMSEHDKGHTELSESVYIHHILRNLSSSQKYVNYTWFPTFLAN